MWRDAAVVSAGLAACGDVVVADGAVAVGAGAAACGAAAAGGALGLGAVAGWANPAAAGMLKAAATAVIVTKRFNCMTSLPMLERRMRHKTSSKRKRA